MFIIGFICHILAAKKIAYDLRSGIIMERLPFENLEQHVRKRLLEDKVSIATLSEELKSLFPGESGFR